MNLWDYSCFQTTVSNLRRIKATVSSRIGEYFVAICSLGRLHMPILAYCAVQTLWSHAYSGVRYYYFEIAVEFARVAYLLF